MLRRLVWRVRRRRLVRVYYCLRSKACVAAVQRRARTCNSYYPSTTGVSVAGRKKLSREFETDRVEDGVIIDAPLLTIGLLEGVLGAVDRARNACSVTVSSTSSKNDSAVGTVANSRR